MISHRNRSHIEFIKSYIKFILDLKTEIKYKQESLIRILENYSLNEYLYPFINKCVNLSKTYPLDVAWDMSFTNLSSSFGVPIEEEKIIRRFATKLGQTDVEGQLQYFEYSISTIKPYLNKAIEDRKKNEKLPIILGLCISLIISVVII